MTVEYLNKNFGEDWCTHTGARGKNTRKPISLHSRAFTALVHVCVHQFSPENFVGFHYYHMGSSFKFHEDQSYCSGDICKTILTIKNHKFSMCFEYFHNLLPPKATKMDNFWIILEFLETVSQNVPIKRKKCFLS